MDKLESLLRKAQQYLRSAAVLLETGDFDSCASRAYFAMFYAAQAGLLQSGYDVASGQGIRSAFVERFVQSGQLPERAGQALNRAYELQQTADYAHHPVVSEEDAERTLQEAEAFVNSLEERVRRAAQA